MIVLPLPLLPYLALTPPLFLPLLILPVLISTVPINFFLFPLSSSLQSLFLLMSPSTIIVLVLVIFLVIIIVLIFPFLLCGAVITEGQGVGAGCCQSIVFPRSKGVFHDLISIYFMPLHAVFFAGVTDKRGRWGGIVP